MAKTQNETAADVLRHIVMTYKLGDTIHAAVIAKLCKMNMGAFFEVTSYLEHAGEGLYRVGKFNPAECQ